MIDFQELPFGRWSRVVRSKERVEGVVVVVVSLFRGGCLGGGST